MSTADPSLFASLDRAFGALDIAPAPDTVEALARYAREIVAWSRRVDLTGAKDEAAFVSGPLFDALTLLAVLDPRRPLLDVGSGGGLPGIPAAITAPACAVTLVEPRARRASFLRHVVAKLALPCEVREARAEELEARGFASAVSQAVWPAKDWIPRAVRLVQPAGAIYVLAVQPLAPADLPDGVALELTRRVVRPFDGAPRFAARLRLALTCSSGS